MDTVDRSSLSSYHEAARRSRAEHVHCLLVRVIGWFRPRPAAPRVAPCGG